MRIVSGLLALLLGLAALLGGIGLQTIWAPPLTLTAEVGDDPTEAPLTVITGEFAEIDEDPVEYTLTGDGDYTVMLGRERDIQAWIGDAAHNTVKGIQTDVPEGEQPHVIVEHAEGEMTVPNPVDSDLWIETHEASGTLEQRWTLPEEDQTALLIAVDGTAPAPTDVTVTWTNRVGDSPWIVPLLVIGPLLILIGLGLLLWAWLRSRRGGRPAATQAADPGQSGRAGATSDRQSSSTARRMGAGAAVGVLVLGSSVLAPATASPSPESASPSSGDQTEEFIPVVVDQQLERILGMVAGGMSRGDEARDAEALTTRIGGSARTMRELHYRNKGFDDSLVGPAPIAASPILAAAATEAPGFPRSIIAVTEGEQNETPQVLLMQQNGPRQQYQARFAVPMTPGSDLSGMQLDQPGVEILELDQAEGLAMSPQQAVDGTAAVLTDSDHTFKDKLVSNSYVQAIQDYQENLSRTARDATIRLNRSVATDQSQAIRLPDGSALVFANVFANVNSSPKERGGTVIASELAQKVAGESSNETTTALYMRFYETMVIHIPRESATGEDARVSLIGFEDELYRVSYGD